MINNYTPGQGCKCHAHSEAECGCDVDWTPREVYELRATISDMQIRHSAAMLHTQSIVNEANELREQRDRLDRKLDEALQETARVRQYMDHGFKVAAEEATELREQRDKAEEKAERYRLEVLQLEAQILALKNRLEEFADAIDFTLDNFSCKTFIPQKFI